VKPIDDAKATAAQPDFLKMWKELVAAKKYMRIRFDGVTQRYDGAPLFEDLDLEIPSGTFFTLLGPSGCGKTTLLRMLAGFVVPDAGRVWFGDRDVTRSRSTSAASAWCSRTTRSFPTAPRSPT
jgi:ABC-type Fe3+/spermidine/putrescine transport system ATPase subunit